MDHLKMHSLNKIDENIAKIAQLFPNCVTEAKDENGEITHKIDFDMLKQELSSTLVEGREERYQFTWPDKKQAILTANAPINKTLRPCREESVNFDETENLYIEGDNLEVLKLLQETYLGKIKMIYIDPPYNTGNDFVYNDDFAQDADDYMSNSGQTDEDGNRLVANTESNGRFHTDWLNMIYPRLKLAKDLLSDDGVIFISIDDCEQENLKKICDEIYGEQNFESHITVIVKPEGRRYGAFAKTHDYIIVYSKKSIEDNFNEIEVEGSEFKYFDNLGGFNLVGLRNRNVQAFNSSNRPNLRYPFFVDVKNPDNNNMFEVSVEKKDGWEKVEASTINGLQSVWRWGKDKAFKQNQDLIAYKGNDGEIRIFQKERTLTQTPKTLWNDKDIISNKGTKEVQELVGKSIFDFPKSVKFVKTIIQIGSKEDSLILDFFSGSATTAHAVMQLNAEDGGNRKFIMVQLPEVCDEKSEAFKAGYKNICEIGKERIRRAGKQILEQVQKDKEKDGLFNEEMLKQVQHDGHPELVSGSKPDIGFRVLKCDSSNMEDVYYSPDHLDKQDLFKNNIKTDRTAEDLLFQVMLDLGIMLSSKIETKQIDGKTVYYVEGNYLVACFDEDVTEETITKIAKETPYYFVMKDSSMANDSVATNFEQIFTTYSPETIRKVL